MIRRKVTVVEEVATLVSGKCLYEGVHERVLDLHMGFFHLLEVFDVFGIEVMQLQKVTIIQGANQIHSRYLTSIKRTVRDVLLNRRIHFVW